MKTGTSNPRNRSPHRFIPTSLRRNRLRERLRGRWRGEGGVTRPRSRSRNRSPHRFSPLLFGRLDYVNDYQSAMREPRPASISTAAPRPLSRRARHRSQAPMASSHGPSAAMGPRHLPSQSRARRPSGLERRAGHPQGKSVRAGAPCGCGRRRASRLPMFVPVIVRGVASVVATGSSARSSTRRLAETPHEWGPYSPLPSLTPVLGVWFSLVVVLVLLCCSCCGKPATSPSCRAPQAASLPLAGASSTPAPAMGGGIRVTPPHAAPKPGW